MGKPKAVSQNGQPLFRHVHEVAGFSIAFNSLLLSARVLKIWLLDTTMHHLVEKIAFSTL